VKKKQHLCRRTKDIEIRPMVKDDFEQWREYYRTLKPSLNKWDSHQKKEVDLTKRNFQKILNSQKNMRENDEFYDLSIFDRKTKKRIGGVSAMNICRSVSQTAFLGYTVHNNFWGQGIGKKSVLAMIDIAFRDLKLHRIEAGIELHNRRSILLAKSIGLRKEGLKKRMVYLRGDWQDLIIYSATCEEFGIKWKGSVTRRS